MGDKKEKINSFKERWSKLTDPERLYVFSQIKNLADEDKTALFKEAIANPEEMKRLAYYAQTGKSVQLGEEQLPLPLERLAAQFAKGPEEVIKKLQKDYPQYEYINYYGDVWGREKGSEGPYQPMDKPGLGKGNAGDKITEAVQDVGELAWPAARAIGETIAAGAAGLGGGLLGMLAGPVAGGAGALTSGAIAGAETSAFLGDVQNEFANFLGYDQKRTPQERADDKKYGLLAGLLGGTGATAKQTAKIAGTAFGKKMALKYGMTPQEFADALYRAQSGVPVKSARTAQDVLFGPMAGNSMSEMAMLRSRMGAVKRMEETGDPLFKLYGNVRRNFEDQIRVVRENVRDAIREAVPPDAKVSTKGVYKAWGDEINRLKNKPNLSKKDQADIEELENMFYENMSKYVEQPTIIEDYVLDEAGNRVIDTSITKGARPRKTRTEVLATVDEYLPSSIPARDAIDLVMDLRHLDDALQMKYRTGQAMTPELMKSQGQLGNALSRISRNAIDSLDSQIERVADNKYLKQKKTYGDFKQLENAFYNNGILTDAKFFNLAESLSSPSKNSKKWRSSIAALDQEFGTSFVPQAQKLALFTKYGRSPSKDMVDIGVSPERVGLGFVNAKRTPATVAGGVMGAGLGYAATQDQEPYISWTVPGLAGGFGAGMANLLTGPRMARTMYGAAHSFPMKQMSIGNKAMTPNMGFVGANPANVALRGSLENYNELPAEYRQKLGPVRDAMEYAPYFNIMSPYNLLPWAPNEGVPESNLMPLYRKEDYLKYQGLVPPKEGER